MALAFYVIGLIGLARGWRNPMRMSYASMARGSLLMLSTMAVGGLVVLVLKRSVARARPELYFEQGVYGLGESFSRSQLFNSFPSSHTYAAFAVAVVLGILAPRWRWVFLLLAALVAVSRLVNLDHYLSDVMTAAGIAVLVGGQLAEQQSGQLQRVLPDWQLGPFPVYAVTETRLLPAKTRIFIEFLMERLGSSGQAKDTPGLMT